MTATGSGHWAPTHSHVRALLAVAAAALGALLLRRPDLVVLVLPLLGVLVWSVLTRPEGPAPRARMGTAHRVLREGDRSGVVVHVDGLGPRADVVAATVTADDRVRLRPRS
uniref:hypothetical protein n=1 Tax=Ornithinicoccus halotolerans TaxID=1748220 RepID=UPI003899093F